MAERTPDTHTIEVHIELDEDTEHRIRTLVREEINARLAELRLGPTDLTSRFDQHPDGGGG